MQCPSPIQPEEVIFTTPFTEASWVSRSAVNTDVSQSSTQPEGIISTLPVTEASELVHSLVDPTEAPDQNYQTEEMNNTAPLTGASWTTHEMVGTNELLSSTQPDEINQMIPESWATHATVDINEAPPLNQEMNRAIPGAGVSWLTQIVNINQAPTYQVEPSNQTMPTPEASWVTQVDTNQAGVQWGVVALVHPNQVHTEKTETTMSAPEPMVIDSEGAWEIHPYIQASLNSLNEPQHSGQQSETNDNPGPLTIDEYARPEYQEDNSTIAIPLITDPNVTPELVTFRPGVYEGDAIPPVYSDFSIIAAPSDYEPPLPSPVYPNISIIPESIPVGQIITEPISDAESTGDHEEVNEYISNTKPIAVKDIKKTPAIEDMVEQELPTAISRPITSTDLGYRGVDPKLLATLRHIKLILIYKDYHFSRYYCQGLKIRWHCVDRKCEAYLYSVGNRITVTHPIHNHLSIISQNSSTVPNIESNAVYSLEEAISTLTDPDSSFNQGTDPSTLTDNDTMTLSYNRSSQLDPEERLDSTQIMTTLEDKNANVFHSNIAHVVLTSGNTIIPHDPSLEITVKSPPAPTENVDDDMSNIVTTVTGVLDPLDVCMTTYTPPASEDTLDLSDHIGSIIGNAPNYNNMNVPKDVRVKVTITSKPAIFKPKVYYDGKLAPERGSPANQICTFTTQQSKSCVTNPLTTASDLATIHDIPVSNSSSVSSIPTFTFREACPSTDTNAPATITTSNASSGNTPIITYRRILPKLNILRTSRVDVSTSTDATTVPEVNSTPENATAHAPTVTTVSTPIDRAGPVISIPSTQIVSGSTPHFTYSHFNSLIPHPPIQNLHSSESDNRAMDNVSRPNATYRIPRVVIPRLSARLRTMTPTRYSQRRSIRLARNTRSTSRNPNQ